MKKMILSLVISTFFTAQAFAYGVGFVSYPWMTDKKIISAELAGVTSTGGGLGIQGRYAQKINSKTLIDAGLGVSGGERTSRIFFGADYELFPDYKSQPKVSLKSTFEHAKEFDFKRNILSVAPTVSKGFSFWGKEAFPFLSIPVGLSLTGDTRTYNTVISANFGLTGQLPFEGYEHLTALIEGIVGLKDTWSGVFLGLSFPVN